VLVVFLVAATLLLQLLRITHFVFALVLLGVGWNFLYIGA